MIGRMRIGLASGLVVLALALAASGQAQQPAAVAPPSIDRAAGAKPLPPGGGPSGEEVYKARCASCHDNAEGRTPPKTQLADNWSDVIVTALTRGVMRPMAEGLTVDEIDAVATYLTGSRPPRDIPVQPESPRCVNAPRFSMNGPSWNGWSTGSDMHRYQPNPGLAAADVPRLKVKWAFTYIGGRYGQPTIVGGRLFIASSSGKVYSLDAKTGCVHWRFDAPAGVRTTLIIGRNPAAKSGYAAYFGDYDRDYFAVDAADGTLIWKTNVESHPRQVLTGSPQLYGNRLIVPVSTWEEVTVNAPGYVCCTARGSIASLDIRTGRIVWKTYMLPEPREVRKNRLGQPMMGPAGAAVWSTPTIDPRRKLIYVTTGDSFVTVPEDATDAVVALDLDTGAFRWKRQLTEGDVYLSGCPAVAGPTSPANCPDRNGPDFDFGASAFLMDLPNRTQILVAGQKSGVVHALNPDTGAIVWQNKIGRGGALGGIEWGMTTEGKRLYVANADTAGGSPGLFALDPATGRTIWSTPSPKVSCGWTGGTRCVNGNSQAPTMIPGAIFSGTIDGHMRAYNPDDGRILWDFDTAAQRYQTINGVSNQPGGALDAAGPTIAGGMMFTVSGYNSNMGGFPNNVLLAFSVDGK